MMPRPAASARQLMRDIEAVLAEPALDGIPMGPTLNDFVVIELINGDARWGLVPWFLDCARTVRARWRMCRPQAGLQLVGKRCILLCWRSSAQRFTDLMLPVLRELDPDRCAVLHGDKNIFQHLPEKVECLFWDEAIPHDPGQWRFACEMGLPSWKAGFRSVCRRHGLPWGAARRLLLTLLWQSRWTLGAIEFLRRNPPAAILVEHDRAGMSSCLVLSGRALGIPVFSMQHGVLDEEAIGYSPLAADTIFCWGELSKRRFLNAGDDPSHIEIGGCPRLTRELTATPAIARSRLALASNQATVLFGSSPVARRLETVGEFCLAMERLPSVSAIIRLHPSEDRLDYAAVAARFPRVRFLDNRRTSLDESLAAADIVVVNSSGVGGDALVKRRPVVVLDIPGIPPGYGMELIQHAGCPCAANATELAKAVSRLLADDAYRRTCRAAAEEFVTQFCAYFGQDSAQRIAQSIRRRLAS